MVRKGREGHSLRVWTVINRYHCWMLNRISPKALWRQPHLRFTNTWWDTQTISSSPRKYKSRLPKNLLNISYTQSHQFWFKEWFCSYYPVPHSPSVQSYPKSFTVYPPLLDSRWWHLNFQSWGNKRGHKYLSNPCGLQRMRMKIKSKA